MVSELKSHRAKFSDLETGLEQHQSKVIRIGLYQRWQHFQKGYIPESGIQAFLYGLQTGILHFEGCTELYHELEFLKAIAQVREVDK